MFPDLRPENFPTSRKVLKMQENKISVVGPGGRNAKTIRTFQ